MAASMPLDYLLDEPLTVGRPAAPPPLPYRGRSESDNKYADERRFSDTAAFSGRSFTLDEDGLVRFLCSSRLGVRKEGSTGMDDRDKRIYNSLGDTSGPKGKVINKINLYSMRSYSSRSTVYHS